ncbi:MAG: carboxypeptidase-like regulatory domain-containing protein, partial [Nitrosopumilus sp.]|nr:carboxypeptidase-like regulatory domain-containing protein [Nitrosopumilus sp.]
MKLLKLLLLMLFTTVAVYAGTGELTGKVIDSKTSESVPGVNIFLEGTTIGTAADFDGNYSIKNIPEGTYTIVFSFISYKTFKIEEVTIKAGEIISHNISLEENIKEIKAVVISADKIMNTENAVLVEIRTADNVVNGVSTEQIARTQDRDASEVVKRIPGVTLMQDRFVMLRGLSERYNSVLINNTTAPSFESDVKSFSFDVVPSSMVDRMLVYKTPAPELPGEFAGGTIKIFTKGIPDKNSFSIGYQTSIQSNTTFKEFYEYQGGNKDWLGIDDGTRKFPKDFPENLNDIPKDDKEALSYWGKSLPNTWRGVPSKAPIDIRYSATLARKFETGKIKVGNFTSLNYGDTRSFYNIKRYDYNSLDRETNRVDTIYKYDDYQYNHNIRWGILHNWVVALGGNHKLEFRNMYNRAATSQTTNREGINNEEGYIAKSYALRYLSRGFYSGQVAGNHTLFGE